VGRILKYLLIILACLPFGEAYAACTVTASGISFGNYDVFNVVALNSTGTITVGCDEAPPPNVTVSIGASPNSGGYVPRKMKHATLQDKLSYNLYMDAAGTSIWGDGTSGTSTVVLNKVKKNKPVTTTIFGIIPPSQNVTIGSYGDLLTVTIIW
jgi:spore coat protein U-like protein